MTIYEYIDKLAPAEPVQLEIGLDKLVYDPKRNGRDTRYFTVRINGEDVTALVAEAVHLKLSKAQDTAGSLIVHGSGMDMGYALQERLWSAAYRAGYPDMFDRSNYKYLGKRVHGRYPRK